MSRDTLSLFDRLNAPFPYEEYKYDSFGDRCYVSGQSVTERLNQVLGVGFWKYCGQHDTEKIIIEPNGKNQRVKIYVEFSIFNAELNEWITFLDVGSEQIKAGMNEGDATKSAITDGMKKCASRIGVASDLYKRLITWDKKEQRIVVPAHYHAYYNQMGLTTPPQYSGKGKRSSKGNQNSELTQKLKQKESATQIQIRNAWQKLAGNLDGLEEWCLKKHQEGVTDNKYLPMLQKRLQEHTNVESA